MKLDAVKDSLIAWNAAQKPAPAKEEKPPILEVRNLHFQYNRKRKILKDINFTIREGEMVSIVGTNGAGKSTTMNILTGYLSSTSGSVSIAGLDVLDNPLEAKKHIGYLPEQPPLYLDMTVEEYLNFVYELKGCKFNRQKHLEEILSKQCWFEA